MKPGLLTLFSILPTLLLIAFGQSGAQTPQRDPPNLLRGARELEGAILRAPQRGWAPPLNRLNHGEPLFALRHRREHATLRRAER